MSKTCVVCWQPTSKFDIRQLSWSLLLLSLVLTSSVMSSTCVSDVTESRVVVVVSIPSTLRPGSTQLILSFLTANCISHTYQV